jgi:hypothetical protein
LRNEKSSIISAHEIRLHKARLDVERFSQQQGQDSKLGQKEFVQGHNIVIKDSKPETRKKGDTKSIINNFKSAMKSVNYKKIEKQDSVVCNTAECQKTGKFAKKTFLNF